MRPTTKPTKKNNLESPELDPKQTWFTQNHGKGHGSPCSWSLPNWTRNKHGSPKIMARAMVPHVPGVSRIGPLKIVCVCGSDSPKPTGVDPFCFRLTVLPTSTSGSQVGRAERPKGLDGKGSPSWREGPKKNLGWKRAPAKIDLFFAWERWKKHKKHGKDQKKQAKRGANSGEEVVMRDSLKSGKTTGRSPT